VVSAAEVPRFWVGVSVLTGTAVGYFPLFCPFFWQTLRADCDSFRLHSRLQTVGVSNQETGHSLSVSSSTVWAEDSDLGLGRICRDFMGKLQLKPSASDTNRAAKTGIYLTAHSQFPP